MRKRNKDHLTNTKQLSICQHCGVMTFVLMDDDGNRFCGKCKQPKRKEMQNYERGKS